MKKLILFAAMLTVMASAVAQSKSKTSIFDIKHDWTKIAGYSYQTGYPYGFSLAGGSFLSFGFGNDAIYTTSKGEQREPTWSIHCGWLGYTFDEDVLEWGAISFRPYVALGLDMAKDLSVNKTKTYFSFIPTLTVNVYMLHFSVGYEIVPAFKEINGLSYGVGFSIPMTPSSSTNKSASDSSAPKKHIGNKKIAKVI